MVLTIKMPEVNASPHLEAEADDYVGAAVLGSTVVGTTGWRVGRLESAAKFGIRLYIHLVKRLIDDVTSKFRALFTVQTIRVRNNGIWIADLFFWTT